MAFYFANFLDAHSHIAGLAFNCQLIKHSRNSLFHPVHSVLLLPVPTIRIGSIDPILNNPSGIALTCNVKCNDSAFEVMAPSEIDICRCTGSETSPHFAIRFCSADYCVSSAEQQVLCDGR